MPCSEERMRLFGSIEPEEVDTTNDPFDEYDWVKDLREEKR